jgi:hypothetical protein
MADYLNGSGQLPQQQRAVRAVAATSVGNYPNGNGRPSR